MNRYNSGPLDQALMTSGMAANVDPVSHWLKRATTCLTNKGAVSYLLRDWTILGMGVWTKGQMIEDQNWRENRAGPT